MGEIKIVDDILAPAEILRVNYEGKNPFTVVAMTPQLLRDVMKITGVDLREKDSRWDITGDPRPFYSYWIGKRDEDRWTTTRIRVITQGVQSSKEKTGWCRTILKGTVETKYEYTNFIQKSFWWFFNYVFYYRQRRQYLDYAKDNINTMKTRIESALGILRE